MATTVRDLEAQKTFIIDAKEKTIFVDAGEPGCWEFDKGLLLNAFRREMQISRGSMQYVAAPLVDA